jgi:hypothetical protein
MSYCRLAVTTVAMAATAALLAGLGAGLPGPGALADPQALVDATGPDRLVAALAAWLAWLAWGWGALGLLLTGLSATPGMVGGLARLLGCLVLPGSTRRAAAVALGLGLTVAAPGLSACSTATEPAAATETLPGTPPVPDWPAAQASAVPTPGAPGPPTPATPATPATGGAIAAPGPVPVPDWPAGDHVVLRGDCLWDIAAADLRARTGSPPPDEAVARAVEAWWAANDDVIGPDPDLLLPGQVLRAPALPIPPSESETPA